MGRTRLGLLQGAARAFADRGLRGSTMQSVAVAAGVAKATLYNHFRTKDDVARALLAAELERLTAQAAGLPLEEALVALSDELGGHPVLRRLVETEPDVLTALLTVDGEDWAGAGRAAGRRARRARGLGRAGRALAAGRRAAARALDHAAAVGCAAGRRDRAAGGLTGQASAAQARAARAAVSSARVGGSAPTRVQLRAATSAASSARRSTSSSERVSSAARVVTPTPAAR